MDELDIRRVAKLLQDSWGKDAAAYAEKRVADLTAQGNEAGRAAWLRITAALAVLQQAAPSSGQPTQ